MKLNKNKCGILNIAKKKTNHTYTDILGNAIEQKIK